MNFIKIARFNFFLCLLPLLTAAQSKFVTFTSIKEENGLSHNKVYDILHDSSGYLWFGTKEGLSLYDGYNFTVFKSNSDDSTSISSNYVQVLYEDTHGQLWIGTYDGGLNVYNRNTRTFKSFTHNPAFPNSISSNNIYAIFEDSNKNLWIGTYGGGLCKYNPAQEDFTVYKHNPNDQNSLSSNAVFDIHEDRNGKLWLATFGGGLCTFDPKYQTFEVYTHNAKDKTSIPSNDLFAISEDIHGNIWIGTYGKGLAKFDRKTETFQSYQEITNSDKVKLSNYILTLEPDASGNLWIGTRDQDISYFNTEEKKLYQFNLNAADNPVAVNKLFIDKSGLLWIATEGEGIYKTYSNAIGFDYLISNGKQTANFFAKSITSIFEDHRGNLWLGTFGDGVYKFNPTTQRIVSYKSDFFSDKGLADNFITVITEDEDKNIWIGTSSNGLSKFNPASNEWHTFLYDRSITNSLNSNSINTLYVDQKGNLWVGTYGGGLCRFNKQNNSFINYEKETFTSGKSLTGTTITSIFEDGQFLWVGTKESGLFRVDGISGSYLNYLYDSIQENSIPSNEITSITKDYRGKLWIGTFDKGICQFDEKNNSFKIFNTTHGLVSDNICGLQSGNDSTIWISTVGGISRLLPDDQKFSNFTASNGLYNQEFVQWSSYKNKEGRLFFGSLGNLVCFDPIAIKEWDFHPPLYTTAFFLYNQRQNFQKPTYQINSIELKHNDNFFEFEYALLSFEDPEKNQYAYMMEGLDKDWKYVNNRRLASYTNLNPGEYVFKIKACDERGVWQEVANPIAIVIHPAWYNTWWFRLLIISIIIGISISYYFYQINAVKKKNVLLETLVAQRTSELVIRNLKIEAQTQKIEEKNANLLEAKAIIEERNRELNVINEELEDRVEQRTSELKKSNDQLIKANAELDMFTYRSYHDIIGPLARIQGLCKVGLLDVKDQMAITYFKMLEENCLEAKTTLHKVLDIYNIKNYNLNPNQVDIKNIIEQVKSKLSANLSSQFSLIKLKCDFATITNIETDAELLENILYSLMENAYQYSQFESDSYMNITVIESATDLLLIDIEDNGIGILPELQDKVFTMFFRGTTNKSGTGLGLYIAKEAAHKLGGTITFGQSHGATSFKITLPRYISHLNKTNIPPYNNTLVSK